MANYNRIVLVGNLTRDPQLKYLPSQMAVVEFGLAVNHKYRTRDGQDREEVLFIDCSCFGKGAEIINQYCQKGRPLLVEGRLKYDTWEDKQGGGKRSKHSVVVENFQLLGGRDGGGGGGGGGGPPADAEMGAPVQSRGPARPPPQPARPPQSPAAAPQPASEPPYSDQQQFNEDDIPF
jgi:single-strand DNA-binding protein